MTAPAQAAETAVERGVEAAWRAMWAPGEPTSPAPTAEENPLLWAQVRAIVSAVLEPLGTSSDIERERASRQAYHAALHGGQG